MAIEITNLVGFLDTTGPPQVLLYRSFRCAMCLFLHDGFVTDHGKSLAIMHGEDFFDRGCAAHCIQQYVVQCWKVRVVVLDECVAFIL